MSEGPYETLLSESLNMRSEEVEIWLAANSVNCSKVDGPELDRILTAWHLAFSSEVKRRTGSWIHERFRWHTFSYDFHRSVSGDPAIRKYQSQWNAEFVVFDETGTWCLSCTADKYPDLTPLQNDLYVSHHNMKWTMAFTHEQPDIGPFFATPQ